MEQARVAETEIHGLFDFRKESIPKLQDRPTANRIGNGSLQSVFGSVSTSFTLRHFDTSLSRPLRLCLPSLARNMMLGLLVLSCDCRAWYLSCTKHSLSSQDLTTPKSFPSQQSRNLKENPQACSSGPWYEVYVPTLSHSRLTRNCWASGHTFRLAIDRGSRIFSWMGRFLFFIFICYVTCISDGLFVLVITIEDRDIQNHTKHLTDINSEVVNVQANLKV